MRIRDMAGAVAIAGLIGASGCSKHAEQPIVQTPQPVSSTQYEYQLGSFFADSGYTVKSLEYADANGVVQKVAYQGPLWRQTLELKPGDRMYVRAEIAYESILGGGIQITSPTPFYTSDMTERFDGPTTVVLMVDRIAK